MARNGQNRSRPKNKQSNRGPGKGSGGRRKGLAPVGGVMTIEEPTFGATAAPATGTTFAPKADEPQVETEATETAELETTEAASDADNEAAIDEQVALWGLTRDHTNVVWALSSQERWDFACTLDGDEMKYLSATNKKNLKRPLPENVAKLKEAAKKEEQRLAAEKAKKEREARYQVEKASWESFATTFKAGLKARLEKDAPGLAPETYATLVDEVSAKYQKTTDRKAKNDVSTVTKRLDNDIKREQKRGEIAEARKKYPKVKKQTLDQIEADVLGDATLEASEFTTRADKARTAQRNLGDLTGDDARREWARLLQVQLYNTGKNPPFERLTDRGGMKTHYSVDLLGIVDAPGVTDATTPEHLVDALFKIAARQNRLHVTLETGATNAAGGYALPHRYWKQAGDNGNDYDFTCDGGQTNRYPATMKRADVKAHLDAAYKELRDRLVARAKTVLDADCNV